MRHRSDRRTLVIFTILILWMGAQSAADAARPPQRIVASLPLLLQQNGLDGTLELLEDKRITPALQVNRWQTGDYDGYGNATLMLVDRTGRLVDSRQLDRPFAKLGTARLYAGDRLTYTITVDYSAGFGSYSGPTTFFAEVSGGKLRWLTAKFPQSGKTDEISVMTSLKTTWKLAPSVNGGKDILEASCRPGENVMQDGSDFVLIYRRYYFAHGEWLMAERRSKGFSEFEDGFPSRTLFP